MALKYVQTLKSNLSNKIKRGIPHLRSINIFYKGAFPPLLLYVPLKFTCTPLTMILVTNCPPLRSEFIVQMPLDTGQMIVLDFSTC